MAKGNDQIRKRIRRPEKTHSVPHEGLVGAHMSKREPGLSVRDEEDGDGAEPAGPGADVAPTRRAEALEHERHQIERDLGRVPAGEEGALRERRAADVTRAMLDEARRQANIVLCAREALATKT